MKLLFITGNKHKLKEAREILQGHEVEGKALDLPELQSLDPEEIVMEKLAAALPFIREGKAALMVEDVSAYAGDTGLPGPFIKFFIEALGREGMVRFCRAFGSDRWSVHCHIGLLLPDAKGPRFFKGSIQGRVVDSRGESGFGFDPIFVPDGHDKTFAEMDAKEKNAISHRRKALEALSEYLKANI